MRLTWRDAVATGLAVAVLALYAAFTAGAGLPLLTGHRSMGVAVLVIGVAMCNIGAGRSFITGMPGWATVAGSTLGLAALLAAVVTIAAASATALAVQVWLTLALWLLATLRHAFNGSPAGPVEPPKAEVLLEHHKDVLPPRLDVR